MAGVGLQVTTEHPFHTSDRGWVQSDKLQAGDTLDLADGKTATIQTVARYSTPTTVYNFTVKGGHNYSAGPAGVLVHNSGGACSGSTGDTASSAAETVGARGGVYSLRTGANEVVRTGRSKDLIAREVAHQNDPVLGGLEFRAQYRTDVYAQQRGLEQKLYEHYPGAMSENGGFNKVRGISPTNPNGSFYMQSAQNYLDSLGGR